MAAEILSALFVKQFMMMARAHSDSIRDGAHFTVVRNDMAAFKLYIEDPQ